MATRFYNYETQIEWEPVERWENEGGRVIQKRDSNLNPVADDFRWHMDVDTQNKKMGELDKIPISSVRLSRPYRSQVCHSDRTRRSSTSASSV